MRTGNISARGSRKPDEIAAGRFEPLGHAVLPPGAVDVGGGEKEQGVRVAQHQIVRDAREGSIDPVDRPAIDDECGIDAARGVAKTSVHVSFTEHHAVHIVPHGVREAK